MSLEKQQNNNKRTQNKKNTHLAKLKLCEL